MSRYIISRLVLMIPVVLGITLLSFVVIKMLPGDLAVAIVGQETANSNPQVLETIRAELGLNRPLHEQYLSWLAGMLRGDFGKSLALKTQILPTILSALPTTVELALLSVAFGLLAGAPIGVLAATRGGVFDALTRLAVSLGVGVPSFFIATLLLLFIAPNMRWIPVFSFAPLTEDPTRNLLSMIFPVISIGTGLAMTIAENVRSAVLDVLHENYVTVAHAKGLSQRVVIWRHVLKNAAIPIISVLGLQTGFLLSGTIIIETIFSLPGLGKLVVTGINLRDYPLVQGVLLFTAVAVVSINLITDLLYAFVDPRIRFR
ncbi:MAG: ABC transporter permease [Chloroflexota bacterium]